MPIPLTEHAIALNVSTLVRDGGTLQLGIGELGDAIANAILLRHRQNPLYRDALAASGILARSPGLVDAVGGTLPFARGLYGCSEMLVDGFLDLYRGGVLRRRVYADAHLQRLLDAGEVGEQVNGAMLDALAGAGLHDLGARDFAGLRAAGVFRESVRLERGELHAEDGTRVPARLDSAEARAAIAATLPGRASARRRAGRRWLLPRAPGLLCSSARPAGQRAPGVCDSNTYE